MTYIHFSVVGSQRKTRDDIKIGYQSVLSLFVLLHCIGQNVECWEGELPFSITVLGIAIEMRWWGGCLHCCTFVNVRMMMMIQSAIQSNPHAVCWDLVWWF